jgi:hypothetical protein
MKVISANKLQKNKPGSNFGAYAHYYKLSSNKGIKVCNYEYDEDSFSAHCQRLLNHRDELDYTKDMGIKDFAALEGILAEFVTLQILQKCKYTPNVYDIEWVETDVKGFYQLGIVMKHIVGKFYIKRVRSAEWKMRDVICSYGIDVSDWHSENVIWDGNLPYRIDFGANSLKIMNNKTGKQLYYGIIEAMLYLMEKFPNETC